MPVMSWKSEDVATADGVNMILDTLAEAFQRRGRIAHSLCLTGKRGTY